MYYVHAMLFDGQHIVMPIPLDTEEECWVVIEQLMTHPTRPRFAWIKKVGDPAALG